MNQITMKLQADHLILEALKEDISSEDVTTNSVMKEAVAGEVDLICKQDGIIAGLEVFERVFALLDPDTKVELYCKDGEEVKNGQLMGKVKGDIRVLLSGERVALNYLQRMSGIATYTNSVAKLLEGSKIKLLDTRKTTPNMRIFEKYAVRAGGGYNHRYNLSDGVLLKDNHIGAAGSVTKAVQMAKEYAPFVRKIEVEVENLDMVKEAVEAGADIIMLDNMSPEDMKKAVEEGRFREDLYYRLAELEIVQPPLKDCKDDILPLAEFFRKEHSGRIRVKNEGFTEEAKACMLGYDWPGNVRELNAKIKRAVIVADNALLDVCDLGLDNVDCSDNLDIRIIQEKERIRNLLDKNHGNVSKTAAELGCSRTSLYKKMKKLDLK